MKLLHLLFVSLLMTSSCVELARDYYQVKSPDGSQTLTFMSVQNLIEPFDSRKRLESGVYLFVGAYKDGMELPTEYLKLKFTDSPLGIVWENPIAFNYNYIEDCRFDGNLNIIIFRDIHSAEYESIDSLYRAKTGDYKTAFFLGEIFRKYQVRPD
jgi:hypothetical protein